ncbi:MAG: hypothetical protein Kow0098_08990 [Ignavibacteriaceae bacterium]
MYNSLGNPVNKNMDFAAGNYAATNKKEKDEYVNINTEKEQVSFGFKKRSGGLVRFQKRRDKSS